MIFNPVARLLLLLASAPIYTVVVLNKVVEAEVIFINKILKYSEMLFSHVTHLMQGLLASAPRNNCYNQSCGSRVDIYRQRLK